MAIVAGIDLGGTAVNSTLLDSTTGRVLIDGLCEHPALSTHGPDVCLRQIALGGLVSGLAATVYLLLVRPLRRDINPLYAAVQVEKTIDDPKNSVTIGEPSIRWISPERRTSLALR